LLRTKKDVLFSQKKTIYHLTNSGTASWSDFARFILKESKLSDVRVRDIPSAQLKRPAPRPANSVLSLQKAKKELSLELRPWQEATQDFLLRLNQKSERVVHAETFKNKPPEEN
jgi:dTDP-4-dehydrorhamnose reductase